MNKSKIPLARLWYCLGGEKGEERIGRREEEESTTAPAERKVSEKA